MSDQINLQKTNLFNQLKCQVSDLEYFEGQIRLKQNRIDKIEAEITQDLAPTHLLGRDFTLISDKLYSCLDVKDTQHYIHQCMDQVKLGNIIRQDFYSFNIPKNSVGLKFKATQLQLVSLNQFGVEDSFRQGYLSWRLSGIIQKKDGTFGVRVGSVILFDKVV